jgi:hypothetical protein
VRRPEHLHSSRAKPLVSAALAIVLTGSLPMALSAQTIEVGPVGGYRFGGDLFELVTNDPVDLDGAAVVGGAVNVEIEDGVWFEALFTRQEAHVSVPGGPFSPATRWHVVVDQWLAGGRQDFGKRVRPFLTGLLGLTRYGIDDDHEVRFTVSAGGGVKLPLQRRLGLRLDSRVFTTFVDADARAAVCAPRGCAVSLNMNVAWQIEFTADLVVVF